MCHVLNIEDEPLVAMEIQEILSREGAPSFEIASTEREAVAAAEANKPSIITSDVKVFSRDCARRSS